MASTQPSSTTASSAAPTHAVVPLFVNRRDLERWVAASQAGLATRGVRVHFGFAPSLDREGPSWVSFLSARGSGRLIRNVDGSSRVDAHAYADGARLRGEGHDGTTVDELESLVDLLAVSKDGR